MGKAITRAFEDSKKRLKKHEEEGLILKTAHETLAIAEQANLDLDKAKARVAELFAIRKAAMEAMQEAMTRARTERKLKAKEARLKVKIAALSRDPAQAKK
jgi:hypothetical protein